MSVTKFEPEVKDKLLVAIRKGAPYQIACNYAGVSYRVFRRWMVRGKAEKGTEYSQFRHDIKEAEGHTALIWLDKIDKAMNDGQWTAAAWKLERRYYKYFGTNPAVIEDIKKVENAHKKIKKKYGGLQHGRKAKEMDSEGSR